MIDDFTIGERVMDLIIEEGLIRVEGGPHVLIWSGNSADQIGAAVKELLEETK